MTDTSNAMEAEDKKKGLSVQEQLDEAWKQIAAYRVVVAALTLNVTNLKARLGEK